MNKKIENVLTFRNIMYIMYWPFFVLWFTAMENYNPINGFKVIHCTLDDLIPFCEWFVFLYIAWYIYEIGICLYTLFNEQTSFEKFMSFVAIGYSICLIVYTIFPNCQNMRPTSFEDQNIATWILSKIYATDTHTNVCPSIHVVGSFASAFAFSSTELGKRKKWMNVLNWILCIGISMSTVFVKQHSFIDVMWGIVVSLGVYVIVYVVMFKGTVSNKQIQTSEVYR